MQFLRIPNLKSANDCFWNLFFHVDSLLIIHGFVCQFPLHYYWHFYNQKQSAGGALWKRCSNKFRKFHIKTPALRRVFNEAADQYSLTLSKKTFRHRWFFVNSRKFLTKPFLKNPSDGCFCRNTRSVYFPSTTLYLFKNDVTHIFRLSIFSA